MEPEAYEELHRLEADHWWYRGMRAIALRLLADHLPRRDDLRILDAGCGVGGNLLALQRFGHASGIDYSPLALAYASAALPGNVARATVEGLPYANDSFDLVTSFDVLYCREVASDLQALAEFARVLRPGGHLLIRLPALAALRGAHDALVHGIRRYSAEDLARKIWKVGMKPNRLTYANSLLLPLIFIIRRAQIIARSAPRSDVQPLPRPLNALLARILALEAAWIGSGHHFVAGVSIICLAAKPTAGSGRGATGRFQP